LKQMSGVTILERLHPVQPQQSGWLGKIKVSAQNAISICHSRCKNAIVDVHLSGRKVSEMSVLLQCSSCREFLPNLEAYGEKSQLFIQPIPYALGRFPSSHNDTCLVFKDI
jgi:hypothetical protein